MKNQVFSQDADYARQKVQKQLLSLEKENGKYGSSLKAGHGGQDWHRETGQQAGSRAHGEERVTEPSPTPEGM